RRSSRNWNNWRRRCPWRVNFPPPRMAPCNPRPRPLPSPTAAPRAKWEQETPSLLRQRPPRRTLPPTLNNDFDTELVLDTGIKKGGARAPPVSRSQLLSELPNQYTSSWEASTRRTARSDILFVQQLS